MWWMVYCYGVSDTTNCHIPVYPAIIKWNTAPHICDCMWFSTACPAVECHLQLAERKTDSKVYCRESSRNNKMKMNFQRMIHCLIEWLIQTSTTDLCCQNLSKHMLTLKHLQYEDNEHLWIITAQSARAMDPQSLLKYWVGCPTHAIYWLYWHYCASLSRSQHNSICVVKQLAYIISMCMVLVAIIPCILVSLEHFM